MRRTAVNVLVALVAAGIIGTALTLLFSGDDEPFAINPRPSPSPTLPPVRSPEASTSPTPSASVSSSPSPSPSPTSATAAPVPSAQPALSVDCDRTPKFCSSTSGTMEIRDEKLQASGTTDHHVDYSGVPTTTMTWRIVREGGGDAHNGDKVTKLDVTVEVHNGTNGTFVVPKREVALVVLLDGDKLHEVVTTGPDFEMRPGGTLTAHYDVPIAFNGEYSWRAKTSFYRK